tara:strand:+ start:4941 stop:5288 length:348 start_codon:yes stop_codon:yes gene_type:complete
MTVVSLVNGLVAKVDSLLTGKLFMYFIMYSYSKSFFDKMKLLSKIPFLANIFGFVIAGLVFSVVSVLSLIEPFAVRLVDFVKNIFSAKIKLEITIGAHQVAAVTLTLVLFLWVIS